MSIFERLLADTPFSVSELTKLIRTAPHRYKVYRIPKRSFGEYRVIAQPTPEIKLLQRWVVSNVLSYYPVHPAAVAYRPNIGIKHNAQVHARQRFLLKLDFKDFFPSITEQHFAEHTLKYAPHFAEDLPTLEKILFRRTSDRRLVLSIGAPSSPALSNSVVYDFDIAVATYAEKRQVMYTRYADDMIFSTNEPDTLQAVYKRVMEICSMAVYPALTLNLDKTVFTSKKWNRTVTGLVLSNDATVSIGWRKKRALRSEVHRFVEGRLNEEEILKLRGYLSFVKDVEPVLFAKLLIKVPQLLRSILFG